MAEVIPAAQPTPNQPQTVTTSSVDEWKGRFEEAVRTRDEAKARMRDVSVENETLKTRLDEINKRDQQSQEQAKQRQLEEQGKYAEALKLTEEKYNGRYQKLATSAQQRLVPMAIKSAASTIESITPEAVQDLPSMLAQHVGLDPESLEVYVRGPDGKPLTDASLKPVPIESFVREFVKSRPYMQKGTMPASHGLTGEGRSQEFTMAQASTNPAVAKAWAEQDPAGYANAVREYYTPDAVLKRAKGRK